MKGKPQQIHKSTSANRTLTSSLLIALMMAIGITACEQRDPLGPPRVHFGQDVCDVCHMIISDDRYAAAVVTQDERGRYEHLLFDDIGCIFELEQARPDTPIKASYVRDYETEQWLDARQAEFVHSEDLHTPMAFGLAALSDLDRARAVQAEYGGDFIRLDEARRRFEQGTLHVGSVAGQEHGLALLVNTKTFTLDDGRSIELVLETPQQIAPGQHEFVFRIEQNGDSIAEQLSFTIEPEMPSMGHGSPGNEDPQHVSGNQFRGLVNFTMSGHWVVHVTAHRDGAAIDTVSFEFEVRR